MRGGDLWPGAMTAVTNAPAHTQAVFDVQRFRRIVEVLQPFLLDLHRRDPFFALAGCGNSGLPVIGALSISMGIPMITVRKNGEECAVRTSERVTGAIDCGRYVIVDDLVSGGGTVQHIMDAIFGRSGGQTVPVAVVAYRMHYKDEIRWKSQGDVRVPIYGIGEEAIRYVDGKKQRHTVDCETGELR